MATNRVTANRVHFSRLERAHLDLVRSLTVLFPPRIIGEADAADIEARVEHLQLVYEAVMAYLEEVLHDTMEHLQIGRADHREIQLIVWDAVNRDPDYDVVASLSRAGCDLGLPAAA